MFHSLYRPLSKLDRKHCRMLIGLLTGHISLQYMLHKMRRATTSIKAPLSTIIFTVDPSINRVQRKLSKLPVQITFNFCHLPAKILIKLVRIFLWKSTRRQNCGCFSPQNRIIPAKRNLYCWQPCYIPMYTYTLILYLIETVDDNIESLEILNSYLFTLYCFTKSSAGNVFIHQLYMQQKRIYCIGIGFSIEVSINNYDDFLDSLHPSRLPPFSHQSRAYMRGDYEMDGKRIDRGERFGDENDQCWCRSILTIEWRQISKIYLALGCQGIYYSGEAIV